MSIDRFVGAGVVDGGHVITEEFAFAAPFAVAGIRLRVGDETAWLSRDEAHEVAFALLEASFDA